MATHPDTDASAPPPLSLVIPSPEAVERVWRDYWLPILRQGGLASLKAELFDYHHLVTEARQVYRHVTGGVTDDLCASAEGIIAMAEAQVERRVEAAVVAVQARQAR